MEKRRQSSLLKWVIIVVLLAGAAWGGWWYWQQHSDKDGPQYRTAEIARGDLTQAVTATGQLNPFANVQVGSQISGMILRIYADFNSSVTQGQVIAELDPSTYRAAVLQAEGELNNAIAGLELTQVEARRADDLRKNKLLAESEYDKAMADLHQAEAQKQIRQALLERARVDLARCTIMAPTNGVVISRNVDVGQTVAASLSAPILFVIANDLRNMQIDAMVSEADIGSVEEGQPVKFTVDAFPTRTFHGKVIQIRNAPATNQNVVTYDTVVSVDNDDLKLKQGMTANVSIIVAERENALRLPNGALRFRPVEVADAKRGGPGASAGGERRERGAGGAGGGARGTGQGGRGGRERAAADRVPVRTVYTVASTNAPADSVAGKPQPKQVKLGISDGAFTEVLEGLNENDIVVIGSNAPEPARTGGAPSNPFGGGGMRRM
jgi:HlyD family secretion protein